MFLSAFAPTWRNNPKGFWCNPYCNLDLFFERLRAAISIALEHDKEHRSVTYSKDQDGVVWFTGSHSGFMSMESYENAMRKCGGVPYDSLPFFNNRQQTIVDVS